MRCSLAGQYYAKQDSSHAQMCDHVMRSMSSTITTFSIEETQAKEELYPGNTSSRRQEAGEKACAALASYKAPALKSQKHLPVGFDCAIMSSA